MRFCQQKQQQQQQQVKTSTATGRIRVFCGDLVLYSKTFLKLPLAKRPKIGFQDQISLNAGQKNCRMLQWKHSAILSTFIKLSVCHQDLCFLYFGWPFKTGAAVYTNESLDSNHLYLRSTIGV